METTAAERQVPRVLAAWSAASIAGGGAAWWIGRRTGRRSVEGFGRQTVMWGAVDAAIAGAGLLGSRSGSNDAPARRRRLRRMLTANAVADVTYIASGAWVVLHSLSDGRYRLGRMTLTSGDGAAIVMQGAFLLALDTVYAARLRGD